MSVRPMFLVALASVLVIALASNVHVAWPVPISKPNPTPTQVPHFALDDVNFGPHVRLFHFAPDFAILADQAVEGADGDLYIAYDPGRGPDKWGYTGGDPTAVGILNGGRIRQLFSMKVASLLLEGLKDGMPLVSIPDPIRPTKDLYIQVSASGIHRLPRGLEPSPEPYSPCIPFDGGKMCDEGNEGVVHYVTRDGRWIAITGERYPYQWGAITTFATDGIALIGGGRHHFLLVEYQNMRGVAECLEGDAP